MAVQRKKMREPSDENALDKQKMRDLENKINLEVGSFLVLIEEGTEEQADLAKIRAKSEYLKFGPEMQKLAFKLGSRFPEAVDDYLDSIDAIVHSSLSWVDESTVAAYCHTMQNLEDLLQ